MKKVVMCALLCGALMPRYASAMFERMPTELTFAWYDPRWLMYRRMTEDEARIHQQREAALVRAARDLRQEKVKESFAEEAGNYETQMEVLKYLVDNIQQMMAGLSSDIEKLESYNRILVDMFATQLNQFENLVKKIGVDTGFTEKLQNEGKNEQEKIEQKINDLNNQYFALKKELETFSTQYNSAEKIKKRYEKKAGTGGLSDTM